MKKSIIVLLVVVLAVSSFMIGTKVDRIEKDDNPKNEKVAQDLTIDAPKDYSNIEDLKVTVYKEDGTTYLEIVGDAKFDIESNELHLYTKIIN